MSQNSSDEQAHKSDAGCELRSEQLTKSNLKLLNSPLSIIFITVFIDLVGFGIMIPILPYYAEEFGGTPFEVGLLFATYSAMQFVFAPVWGQLSDKYGRRPILFLSLLGTSAGFLILALANSLWLVFAGRILSGIMGANISTAQAYIADVTTEENRARGMGLIGAAFGLGFIFGPALGGVLSKFSLFGLSGVHTPFFFASALALANAIFLYFILPETVKRGGQNAGRRARFVGLLESLNHPRFGMIILLYFLVVVAFSMMTTAFPLYTGFSFGYTPEQNGYLFAFIGMLAAIMQGGLIGFLTARFGEIRLVAAGCLILVISLFAVPFVSSQHGGLLWLLVGLIGLSVGNSISTPSLTTLGSKLAPGEQGASLGVLQSSASLARALGPAIAGILLTSNLTVETLFALDKTAQKIDAASLFRMYWTAAAIMLAAFLLSLYFVTIGGNLAATPNAGD